MNQMVIADVPNMMLVVWDVGPSILIARLSDLLRPDSRMLAPLVDFLKRYCCTLTGVLLEVDKGMMFGTARLAQFTVGDETSTERVDELMEVLFGPPFGVIE